MFLNKSMKIEEKLVCLLKEKKLKPIIIGDGDIIVEQYPKFNKNIIINNKTEGVFGVL